MLGSIGIATAATAVAPFARYSRWYKNYGGYKNPPLRAYWRDNLARHPKWCADASFRKQAAETADLPPKARAVVRCDISKRHFRVGAAAAPIVGIPRAVARWDRVHVVVHIFAAVQIAASVTFDLAASNLTGALEAHDTNETRLSNLKLAPVIL